VHHDAPDEFSCARIGSDDAREIAGGLDRRSTRPRGQRRERHTTRESETNPHHNVSGFTHYEGFASPTQLGESRFSDDAEARPNLNAIIFL
jgi:hypothetical protein